MIKHIIDVYQAANPDVLLNPVLNGDINIYSYTDLPTLLGPGGFDVMELDTLYLNDLASKDLVVANTLDATKFMPAGVTNVTYAGATYGVPSWLCSNFLFAFDQNITTLTSLGDMTTYMGGLTASKARLAGVFLGSWGLPSDYLFGYAANNGFANIATSLTAPIDTAVVANLNTVSNECAFNSANECITQSGYKSESDGQVAKLLSNGTTSTYMGFSEQSFYIELFGGDISQLYLIPMLWGTTQSPMLYTDAFVTSQANCSVAPCLTDAIAFTDIMITDDMRNYIAFSQDLPAGSPARHLAVATRSFYAQAAVIGDPIYSQLIPVVNGANAFPNYITEAEQASIHQGVCTDLKAINPAYECKLVAGESRNRAFDQSSQSARREIQQFIAQSNLTPAQDATIETSDDLEDTSTFERILKFLRIRD